MPIANRSSPPPCSKRKAQGKAKAKAKARQGDQQEVPVHLRSLSEGLRHPGGPLSPPFVHQMACLLKHPSSIRERWTNTCGRSTLRRGRHSCHCLLQFQSRETHTRHSSTSPTLLQPRLDDCRPSSPPLLQLLPHLSHLRRLLPHLSHHRHRQKWLPNNPALHRPPPPSLLKHPLARADSTKLHKYQWLFDPSSVRVVLASGGARTMEIGPIRNQNLIFWPLDCLVKID